MYKRTSIFYLIGVFGSATGGVLGLAFSKMNGLGGYGGWRWIFILEGIATVLAALVAAIFLPADLPSAKFFTEEERAFSREVA